MAMSAGGSGSAEISVHLAKERFKFNCAHFVAYKGFRERLHGHNYTVRVTLSGSRVNSDGYVIDFGDVKKHVIDICKEWNEHFICPTFSDTIDISRDDEEVVLICEDGARFLFPSSDCLFLPIVHSTAEELAMVFADRIVGSITLSALMKRGITKITVSVGEHVGQEALFALPLDESWRPCEIFPGKVPFLETNECKGCLENVLHAHRKKADPGQAVKTSEEEVNAALEKP